MLTHRVDELIQKYMKKDYFSGAVCHILQGEKLCHESAYGYSSKDKQLVPMHVDTLFDLASITKIVTSTVILRLVSEQRLSLDQSIDQVLQHKNLPKLVHARFQKITIKQLLTHSSGLIAWYPFYTQKGTSFYDVLDQIFHSYEMVPNVTYSDLNYMLLGKIIESITDLSLDAAVKEYVSLPLGSTTLSYLPDPQLPIAATEYGNRIEQEMVKDRGLRFAGWRSTNQAICAEVNDGNAHYYFNGVAGHAGLFGTAADLTALAKLYLQEGVWEGRQLLNRSLTRQSWEEQVPTRGLGWEISSLYPRGCGHTGFTGTSMWLCPEEKIVVVLLTNRLHTKAPANLRELRQELHKAVYLEMYSKK